MASIHATAGEMAEGRLPNVVFLDRDILPADIKIRDLDFPNEFRTYAYTLPGEVGARIADADVVILNKVPLGADALAMAPRLRFVAVAATGYDNVDVAACIARGVAVSN